MDSIEDFCQFGVSLINTLSFYHVSQIIELYGSDLALLRRDRKLQQRYDDWAAGITAKYGSIGKHFLLRG